jgi:ribonuclease BN (tRNA processing enzyme)
VGLELTVLGCAGSHPGPGRLCSGYLVRSGRTTILLDAGNGSTANLQRLVPLQALDAVVISHRHVDHCIDLIGMYYALRFDPSTVGRIPLYAAPEVHGTLTGLLSSDSQMPFDEVFRHTEVGAGDEVLVGDLALRFAHSVHVAPTVSVRVEVDGTSLVYSGDSAGGPDLVRIASGADLFLCEATWAGDADLYPEGVHLTARQAAEVAAEADVGRLVLTHIAGGTDREQVLREAREVFDGSVELAEDLALYRLP